MYDVFDDELDEMYENNGKGENKLVNYTCYFLFCTSGIYSLDKKVFRSN